MKILSLSRNRVDYIAEDAWEFCDSLEDLDLSENRCVEYNRSADTPAILAGTLVLNT